MMVLCNMNLFKFEQPLVKGITIFREVKKAFNIDGVIF